MSCLSALSVCSIAGNRRLNRGCTPIHACWIVVFWSAILGNPCHHNTTEGSRYHTIVFLFGFYSGSEWAVLFTVYRTGLFCDHIELVTRVWLLREYLRWANLHWSWGYER
nr:hypothetical protein CFP56_43331 [Quercus suber]